MENSQLPPTCRGGGLPRVKSLQVSSWIALLQAELVTIKEAIQFSLQKNEETIGYYKNFMMLNILTLEQMNQYQQQN